MTAALAEAKAVLSGDLVVPVHSVRAAAWLARSALEESLGVLGSREGFGSRTRDTGTLLSCVEVLFDNVPGLAILGAVHVGHAVAGCPSPCLRIGPDVLGGGGCNFASLPW